MTKLFGISALILGLTFAAGTTSGCDKKDDKAAKKDDKKDEAKKDEAKKDEAKKDEAKKDEPKKDEAQKDEAKADDKTKADDASKTAAAEVKPGATTAAAGGDLGPDIKKAVDEVCACKDRACAEAVSMRMKTLVTGKMATMKQEERMAFAMKLQKEHATDMKRAEECAKRFASATDGKTTPTGSGLGAAGMKQVSQFADKVCACKDNACAQGVMQQMMAWGMKNKGLKPTPEEMQKMMPIQKRMGECYKKLMMAGKK